MNRNNQRQKKQEDPAELFQTDEKEISTTNQGLMANICTKAMLKKEQRGERQR